MVRGSFRSRQTNHYGVELDGRCSMGCLRQRPTVASHGGDAAAAMPRERELAALYLGIGGEEPGEAPSRTPLADSRRSSRQAGMAAVPLVIAMTEIGTAGLC